jgi:hypothetical protein
VVELVADAPREFEWKSLPDPNVARASVLLALLSGANAGCTSSG